MTRIKTSRGKIKNFLNNVAVKSGLNAECLGEICGVSGRTVRDWRREKHLISYEAASKLSELYSTPIPENVEILPHYWYTKKGARKGALSRYKIYGNPGTPEGRRRGGLAAQEKFHADPAYAKRIGIVIRKDIKKPARSELLAEFMGIMLGDGGMTGYQAKITFNHFTDMEHSKFIQTLIKKLFSLDPIISRRPQNDKGDNIVVSSRNLVEFLEDHGLKKGDKIRNGADIPNWIWKKQSFVKGCLRGLIDTDGSFYSYAHRVNGHAYKNFAMCFTNYSKPLLNSTAKALKVLGFTAKENKNRVYLHKVKEIDKYFELVGTSNPKHLKKYTDFIANKA